MSIVEHKDAALINSQLVLILCYFANICHVFLIDFKLPWLDIILDWQGDERKKVDSKGCGVKGCNGKVGRASFYMELSKQ